MPVPTTLPIYITTTIPGSQFIKYKPNMTIPSIEEKNVLFNPLVKLSQNIIDKTPQQDKVTQFFEKGLFHTLMIRSEKFKNSRNLKKATKDGIVDNNIRITLQNIFKPNSVFYIDKRPYTIYSFDWEKGDWQIDTKISDVPSTYKGQYGINTMNYRYIMEEQLKQAKEELNSLPTEVLRGTTYKDSAVYPKQNSNTNTHVKKLSENSSSSNIRYYVDITLSLYPGTEIPLSERPLIGCRNIKYKLHKAWGDLIGKKYLLQPHYENTQSNNPANNKANKTQKKINKYGGKTRKRKNK